jgi:hypothetical protein
LATLDDVSVQLRDFSCARISHAKQALDRGVKTGFECVEKRSKVEPDDDSALIDKGGPVLLRFRVSNDDQRFVMALSHRRSSAPATFFWWHS